ncbi:MAG: hypothetical protein GX590_08245 [Lentisphaerae bacterium]|nr:hypothetical protein [Lentisphaerota bacterium]
MRPAPFILRLVGAALLAAAAGAARGAAYTALKPMVIVSFASHDRVMQRAGLGCQGIGMPAGAEAFQRQFEALLLVPGTDGIDRFKPGHIFLLSPDPPDALPFLAALLPVADGHGATLLASLRRAYGAVERHSGVTTCAAPVDPAAPPRLAVAIAERHALVASRVDGVRWLARHRRDRTLPQAGLPREPLRLTADGPLLGLFLQLFASLNPAAPPPAGAARLFDLNHHLNALGDLLSAFETLDLGLDGGIRAFSATLQLNAPTNAPLAARIRALEPPAPAFDRQLGDDPLNASVGSLPALLADLPAAAITWFEELAEATQLVGLRIAPRMPGWLTLLQPIGSGQVAHALHRAPRGVGLFSVQRFAFADARRAEAALGLLEPLLPAPGAGGGLQPLVPRRAGTHRIIGYRIDDAPATNRTSIGTFGDVATRLLRLNTVEITSLSNELIVVRGPSGTLDEWLAQPPGPRDAPSLLDQARREFDDLLPGETLVGAGQAAPTETLRAAMAAIPGLAAHLSALPIPGDAFRWRVIRRDASLAWSFQFPANELMACRQLRELDTAVLQEMLSNYVLDQFGRAATERSEKEMLKERLRRLGKPRDDG